MALIPLKQTMYLHKYASNHINGWKNERFLPKVPIKCRAVERTELVTNKLGEQEKSTVKIYVNKLSDIRMEDLVEFTNENGLMIKREPITIRPIRMVNGKATLTVIYL